MRIKLFIWLILIPCFAFIVNSCQKDDNTENLKEVDICPEVAMGNFEEVGMIINDYLTLQTSNNLSENLSDLKKYLSKCNCIQSVKIYDDKNLKNAGIREIEIEFVVNGDTLTEILDLRVMNNDHLEFRKFEE
jgi:hypothetical protein